MKTMLLTISALGAAAGLSSPAFAQEWVPGQEILGQPVTVTTNGATNTLVFEPGGTVMVTTPSNTVARAAWSVARGQLCISNSSVSQCWPYNSPFQAQQPVTLTSSCGSVDTLTAQSVNQASQRLRGERGR